MEKECVFYYESPELQDVVLSATIDQEETRTYMDEGNKTL